MAALSEAKTLIEFSDFAISGPVEVERFYRKTFAAKR
jgi:hypothetical protein